MSQKKIQLFEGKIDTFFQSSQQHGLTASIIVKLSKYKSHQLPAFLYFSAGFQELIILTLQKMTSKFGGQGKIIIPALRNHYHSYIRLQEQRDIDEEENKVAEPKIFLAPKYESRPFALTLKASQHLPNLFSNFTPEFQKFDLSHFFSNKLLNQEQAAAFSSIKNLETKSFQTPVRENSRNFSSSNFKMLDTNLNFTAESIKNQTKICSYKKSRPTEKGLKKLSQRGYQIVLKMRSVLYKEVANKLIDQLNMQHELNQESKDQQNIKRRVYDALNVLIALGVLRKEGRKIVGDYQSVKNIQQNKVKELSSQMKKTQNALQLKRQKLKQLQQKYKIYKQLAQSHQGKSQESQVIKFPFLALCNLNQTKFTVGVQEQGECRMLKVAWIKSQKDRSQFDIDLLAKNQKITQSKQKV